MNKDNRIIPGVYGVIRFLADGINSVPVNDVVIGMETMAARYSIAEGRILGTPLGELNVSSNIMIDTTPENVTTEEIRPRFYDDFGLGNNK